MRNNKSFLVKDNLNENNNLKLGNHLIIADELSVLLCRFKKDCSIVFVNKVYARFFNTTKENLIDTKFFIKPDELERTELSDLISGKIRKQFSLQLSDNTIHWIEWTINRVSNQDSDEYEYLAIGQDVSEYKLREEYLSKISAAIEQSKSTVLITDTFGDIEYVNSRFTEITGFTIDDVKGKNTRFLKSGSNDEKVYKELWETISAGKEWRGELINKKKNGELFWELVTISPVKNSDNIITNYLAVKEDISESKKSEMLEKAVYQISHAVFNNENLNELYFSIHQSLAGVLPVDNLFIAIYDKEKNLLSFPYFVDEFDEPYETAQPGNGLTEYVLRTGIPLHVNQEIFKSLVDKGEVDLYGTDSLDWIGVPLKNSEETFGVVVVQSYSEKVRLDKRDLNVLIYVSDQIAIAIERTRTLALLKKSEERYRLLFHKAADSIVIIDQQGKVLDVNNIFEVESGCERYELIGKNIFNAGILSTKSSITAAFYLSRLMMGKEIPIFEIEGITKGGSSITYELRAVPIKEHDQLIGVQSILRNVTERKKTEAKLHQSEKQLSNFMANLPGMAYRCRFDDDWTMEFVSQGCLELTGYSTSELMLNSKVSYMELIHPEDKENVFVTIRESINKKTPYQLLYRIRTKSGSEKWVWEKGNVHISKKQKAENLEGFVTDISSRITAEIALKESEELYRKLLATLPDIICITDIKGKISFLNEVGMQFAGCNDIEEIRNKSVFNFIVPYDRKKAKEGFNIILKENLPAQELHFIKNDGQVYLFEVQREILTNGENIPYGFIFSCRDITSRKKTELELIQSEEKYRTLIDSMQDAVFLILDGYIGFINRAFCNMLGYETYEVEGEVFTKFIAPEDRDLVVNNYKLRLEGKPAASTYEVKILHKNGNRVFVNLTARAINYKEKQATIGTLKDITHQKKLEQILVNQTKLFKGVAEAANILLTERNLDNAIAKTLKSLGQSLDIDRVYIFENYFDEHTSEPMLSQKYEWTNEKVNSEIMNPEMQNMCYYPLLEDWHPVLNRGGIINCQVKDLKPQLKDFLSSQNIKSILIVPIMVNNKFWGFIGFDYCQSERIWNESEISILQTAAANIGGILERETANKELIAAKETAEEMSKLKSNFLANMSHELRTPLIAILGYTEILKSEVENKEWREMISTVMQSGKRLMETLNLLLDLSRVEADKVTTNFNEINVAEEINEVVTMLGPTAQKKNLYLKSKTEKDIILVKLDKRLLHSVITNLVNNAIKYTNKGGITIELTVINSSEKDYLMIRVIDTGIGIAKEDQESIFEEFRQVSEGYNRHFEGAGLGLTIARKFAEKMGGSISLESEVNKGSTFTVVFPIENLSNHVKPEIKKANEHILPAYLGKAHKALVVDDDIATRKIAELFLRGEIELESASNSKEAIELISNNLYSLVLMDISLGKGKSGVEVLRHLRTLPQYKNVPVIAVTAHAMVGDKEKFLASGFDDYLSKPFGKNDLINKVHNWVAFGNSIGK